MLNYDNTMVTFCFEVHALRYILQQILLQNYYLRIKK